MSNGLLANGRWLIAATLLTLLSLGVVFAPGVYAAAPVAAPAAPPAQGDTNTDIITNGDLVVEAGRTVNGDAVVFSGDVVVEANAVINGDVVAMSGDLELERSARITGDAILFSGDADIDGEIQGDLSLWSGDIELGDNAMIGGDVSLLSGNLDSNDDAVVSGSITHGPNFDLSLPLLNSVLGAARQDVTTLQDNPGDRVVQIDTTPNERANRVGFGGWLLRTVARLFRAALFVGLLTLGVSALTVARPAYVRHTSETAQKSLAPAFALGLVVTLVLGVFASLLRVPCLFLLGLLPGLLLLVLGVAGWAAIGQLVGERLKQMANLSLGEAPTVAVSVTLVAGLIGAVGALGFCFRPIAWLLLLMVTSLGVGAVLLPWAQRLLNHGESNGSPDGSGSILTVPDKSDSDDSSAGAAAYSTPAQSTTDAPQPEASQPEEPQPEADSTTQSTVDAETSTTQSQQESRMNDQQSNDQQSNDQRSDDNTPAELAASETLGAAPEEVQELESGDSVDTEQAAEVQRQARAAGRTESDDSSEDDLTRIQGIGQTFDRRLKEAGVRTYVDLANMTPEAVSEIIGWSPERVQRDDLIGQARTLASEAEV